MKYFYDTEFIEGPQKKKFLGIPFGNTPPTIDLISIGIVSEEGKELYLISKDFNIEETWNRYDMQVVPTFGDMRNMYPEGKIVKKYWLRENVLMPIFFDLAMEDFHNIHFKDQWYYKGEEVTLEVFKKHPVWSKDLKWFKKLINKYGKSLKVIRDKVEKFLKPSEDSPVELYGDYSAYDHVALCWLFGLMKDLPNGMPYYTIDLRQMLEEAADFNIDKLCYATGNHTIMSKKDAIEEIVNSPDYPKQVNDHVAIADARWNKELYRFIKTLN